MIGKGEGEVQKGECVQRAIKQKVLQRRDLTKWGVTEKRRDEGVSRDERKDQPAFGNLEGGYKARALDLRKARIFRKGPGRFQGEGTQKLKRRGKPGIPARERGKKKTLVEV